MKTLPSREDVSKVIRYDAETGLLWWIAEPCWRGGKRRAGSVAGHKNKRGYVEVRVLGRFVLGHRLAWLMAYGEWPDEVDHINGNPSDNRLQNLRSGTHAQNTQNLRRPRTDNSSGFLGVHRSRDRFKAEIQHAGRRIHIGVYDTAAEAHAAYVAEKRRLHEFGSL